MVEFYFFLKKNSFLACNNPFKVDIFFNNNDDEARATFVQNAVVFFILLLFQNAARDNGIPNAKTSRGECEQTFKK